VDETSKPLPSFDCPSWCTADHNLEWVEVTKGFMTEDEWSPIHEGPVYSLNTADSDLQCNRLERDGVGKIALDADAELTLEQARSLALQLLACLETYQAT
jgi:hypothetical protein